MCRIRLPPVQKTGRALGLGIQGIRACGTDSEIQQIQAEVTRRLRRLRTDAKATFTYHLLNGIQGKLLNPKEGAPSSIASLSSPSRL